MTTPHWVLAAIAVAALTTGLDASAAPVDAVSFGGTFLTTCSMPSNEAGPRSGRYACTHAAQALGCAGIADSGAATSWLRTCRADLTHAKTRGFATNAAAGRPVWTCDSGAGTGWFAYRPSPGEPTFRIPVTLAVVGQTVVVDGAYTQRGTGRTMVVRARFPAVCAWATQVHGYEGTLTPA